MKSPVWSLFLVAVVSGAGRGGDHASSKETNAPNRSETPALEMSKAVVCKRVGGYEDYDELPDASLTNADKLNVYFRPLNYRVEPVRQPRPGRRYQARFSEDCRIRRKGEKTVLMKKDKLLEFDAYFEATDYKIYLLSNISLKGLAPGEYELDVVLHDVLEPDASTTQSVAFKVVPITATETAEKTEGTTKAEAKVVPAHESKKTKPTTKGKS